MSRRIITAREQHEMQNEMLQHTAVQTPPQALQLKYWPDNSTIARAPDGSMPFMAPAVSAHLGDRMVGSLEWYPHYDFPGANNDKHGEVSMIKTHPDHQRQGIATAMYDHARQFEPKLHHSELESGAGQGWARAEEAR